MSDFVTFDPVRENGPQSEYIYPIYFYAGFWSRFFAWIIDLSMVFSIQVILMRFPLSFFAVSQQKWYLLLVSLGEMILLTLYFVLMTKWTNGQTIGKIIMGLRVVHIGYPDLDWTTVIVREGFGRVILTIIPPLYGLIFFTRKKQHFTDILCDTSVISEKIYFASSDAFVQRRQKENNTSLFEYESQQEDMKNKFEV